MQVPKQIRQNFIFVEPVPLGHWPNFSNPKFSIYFEPSHFGCLSIISEEMMCPLSNLTYAASLKYQDGYTVQNYL